MRIREKLTQLILFLLEQIPCWPGKGASHFQTGFRRDRALVLQHKILMSQVGFLAGCRARAVAEGDTGAAVLRNPGRAARVLHGPAASAGPGLCSAAGQDCPALLGLG